MNTEQEELLRESVEYQAEQREKEEKAFMLLLIPLIDTQLRAHQDLIRKTFEKFSVDGLLPKNELFKYGRDKSIRSAITDIFKRSVKEETLLVRNTLKSSIQEHYNHTLYTLDVMGLKPRRTPLKASVVNDVVDDNWSGQNIKEIIQKDKMEQITRAYNQLVMAATNGLTMKQVIKDSKKIHTNALNKSMLNYQTELTRVKGDMAEIAAKQVKEENKWIILVTLDERTCKECGPLDKKIFSDDKPIKLPVHPRCRCVKTFYLPDDEFIRRARNPETGENYLTDDITYEEWKKGFNLDEIKKKSK